MDAGVVKAAGHAVAKGRRGLGIGWEDIANAEGVVSLLQ